jgi:CRP/FNR family transcriptional regulator, cyclic AMP receptor protein
MNRPTLAIPRNPSLHLRESERDMGAPHLFARLEPAEYQRLQSASAVLRFRAGQDVFRQDDPHHGMFVILSGEVKTYYTGPSGREITLAYWAPGNFVGGPEVEHKGKCYSTMIHMLGTRSASERLAQMLVLLAERDGRRTQAGIVIARRLTHEDLAKMVGATRQWVTAMMERLMSQGMIDIHRTRIVVLDEQRLRRFADCPQRRKKRGSSAGAIAMKPFIVEAPLGYPAG